MRILPQILCASVLSLSGFSAWADTVSGILFDIDDDSAVLLVLDDINLNTGARLGLDQDGSAGGAAEVTGPSGEGVRISLPSGFSEGLVIVNVIANPEARTGEDEAVVGDLDTPLFTLDEDASNGLEDGTPDSDVAIADTGPDLTISNPELLTLVRRWIASAIPTHNAMPGYQLRYSQWGILVGRTPTGRIRAVSRPDDARGYADHAVYLWERKPELQSLNLCRLRDFVLASLSGDRLDHCGGSLSGFGSGSASVTGSSGRSGPEIEPNNRRDEAQEIALGDAISGQILPRGEADFFRVTLAHQGELSVLVTRSPPELNMAVRVLSPAGGLIGNWQTAESDGEALKATWDIAAPGDYILEVRDGGNSSESDGIYQLTTRFIATADPAEPNNARKTATVLEWDTPVRANILPRGEADHYRVTLAHQGELTVSFPYAPPELDMAFRVLSPAGSLIWNWQTAKTPGAAFSATADIAKPGNYIIEVRDGGNSARSASPYTMIASLIQTADSSEPNDGRDTATPLALGIPMRANILPRGEPDHYLLDLTRQGELSVSFDEVPVELNPAFRVLSPKGSLIWNWQGSSEDGEPFSGWADIAAPGKYVLEIRDGGNSARSARPYRVLATHKATSDTAEPNNTRDTATPIDIGATLQASILPRGDADHYLVELPKQGELSAHFDQAPENLDMAFRVLSPTGSLIWNWQGADAEGKPFSAWADVASPGQYILEVRDGGNSARSPLPYSIRTQFIATHDPAEPNNDRRTATPLMLGAPIMANILPRGEADYYAVTLPAGILNVSFPVSPDDLDMAFRVLTPSGSLVGNWQTAAEPGQSFSADVEIKQSGKYIIEVRDGGNSARSHEPYTIVARMK